EVSGAAGAADEVALLLGDVGGEEGHAEHHQADGIDEARALRLAAREQRQRVGRQLELTGADEQQRLVIARDSEDVGVSADPELQALLDVLESVLVVRHPKVAQATERPSRAGLRLESEEAAERLPRLAVAVGVVEERREVPPALVPSRPELHALAVEADGLGQAVAFPRARRPS